MGARSPIHWLIIVVVLAVPAGLIWLIVRSGKTKSEHARPREFRDLGRLTRVLQFLLVILIVTNIIAALSDIAQYRLLQSTFTKDDASVNDTRQQIIAVAYLFIFAVTTWVFGRWIYRANCNARALHARSMTFTPGWSVGWYFVPFACLWKPYQAMRELWKASKNPQHWQDERANPILGWWWASWIISNILGQVSFRLSLALDDISSISFYSLVNTVTEAFDVLATALALVLITRLGRMQADRHKEQLIEPPSEANAP